MQLRLFGVGLGILILVVLWSSSFLISVSVGKTRGVMAVIGLNVLTALVSLALIFWPIERIENADETMAQITQYDNVFIPRLVLVIFLVLVVLVVIVQYLTRSVLATTSASSVKNRHGEHLHGKQQRLLR